MVINHNMSAFFASRQLGVIGVSLAKDMEKLSSGERINRAGDDASGLAVSEKMRSQIRGLNQTSTNAQNGISFIMVIIYHIFDFTSHCFVIHIFISFHGKREVALPLS